ncbi:MAG: uracil-DNA glycosylase [Candidatus Hadarchaeaceae archaeon]
MRELEIEAKKCKRCRLHKTRTNVVFGTGPANARIMLIGEASGFNEDKSGVPFVGAAGKNLDILLQTAGLKRNDVYITNTVLCRPPQNRDPLPDETEACKRFLEGHISVIKPKLIIALGRIAAGALLGRYVTMGREHGTLLDCTYAGVSFKLFLTYHPAAALYGAETKSKLQADFRKLGSILKSLT